MTWEPASTLPQVLIDEFESGTGLDEQMITDIRFGVVNHTLVMAPSGTKDAPPQKKKAKTKVSPSDSGYDYIYYLHSLKVLYLITNHLYTTMYCCTYMYVMYTCTCTLHCVYILGYLDPHHQAKT